MSIETSRVSLPGSGLGRRLASVCSARHAVRDDVPAVRGPLRAAAEVAVLGDPLQPGAVGMNDVESTSCRCSQRPCANGIVLPRSDENAIHLPSGDHDGRKSPPAPGRQRLRAPRLQIHRPQIGRAAAARGDEHELLAVGRKRRLIVVRRAVGEPLEAAAVRLHAKQIGGAVALGREHDRSRRRATTPGRSRCRREAEQRMLVAAVGGGDEQADLAGVGKHAREDDLAAVRVRRQPARGSWR